MPRDRATIPPPPTDLEAWLSAFRDELQRLRPHMTDRLANMIGRAEYLRGRDAKKAAAAYHTRQGVPREGRW